MRRLEGLEGKVSVVGLQAAVFCGDDGASVAGAGGGDQGLGGE